MISLRGCLEGITVGNLSWLQEIADGTHGTFPQVDDATQRVPLILSSGDRLKAGKDRCLNQA